MKGGKGNETRKKARKFRGEKKKRKRKGEGRWWERRTGGKRRKGTFKGEEKERGVLGSTMIDYNM